MAAAGHIRPRSHTARRSGIADLAQRECASDLVGAKDLLARLKDLQAGLLFAAVDTKAVSTNSQRIGLIFGRASYRRGLGIQRGRSREQRGHAENKYRLRGPSASRITSLGLHCSP